MEAQTSSDTKQTIKEEWGDISYTARFVGILSALMLICSFAILARPINPVSNYIVREFGVQADFYALILFVMSIFIVLIYRITKNMNYVALCSTPAMLLFFSLAKQISESETAPFLHLVTSAFVIILLVLLFNFVRRIDDLELENQVLYEATLLATKPVGD